MSVGILLINLGTPDAPTEKAVKKYLRQFLSDPYVLDINPLSRWFLVNFIIAPFRSPKSAEAYEKIWTRDGSPLLAYTQAMTEKLRQKMNEEYIVEMGMRYGNPSIESGIKKLLEAKVEKIIFFPLYPQFALSSTMTAIEEVHSALNRLKPGKLPIEVLEPFYDHPAFLDAYADLAKPFLKKNIDHILFSFHGLPERHIKKTDPKRKHCLVKKDCCAHFRKNNPDCYRAQCFETAHGLASRLHLKPEDYTICFQSRLGRTPWLKPFTDELLMELPKKGMKNLAVLCPSFVADCLETMEEIGIRGRKSFKHHGGEELTLIPCLNDNPQWIEALFEITMQPLPMRGQSQPAA